MLRMDLWCCVLITNINLKKNENVNDKNKYKMVIDEIAFVRTLKEDTHVELYINNRTGQLITYKKIPLRKFKKQESSFIALLNALKNYKNSSTLLEYRQDDEFLHLYFEFIDGDDLFDYIINEGPLPESRAKELFKQLVNIISYIHSLGYVHRDIKLENIIITQNGELKLIDWEFACKWRMDMYLNMHCGSIEYASPEMLAGRTYIGPEVDIYSLGVVLYGMLTAQAPFKICKRRFRYYRANSLKCPNYLSKPVQNLLHGMLCSSRHGRWTMQQIQNCDWVKSI